ncbi:PulJ/GspJ family protein [Planctopirus hydrillae]|uniref:Prepilin-type N-terminal cleavage/methylation domain-containing protein n=1 Tax=Planctopirus hydrillae TaxID=1841610 RepID=A0A1C3EA33_9PLAN|nr:type II secretion system protein [Planctopirus hydrillae]ODA30088.1 hypothetical protein A6X21_07085 [Planctopirus hydrillae]
MSTLKTTLLRQRKVTGRPVCADVAASRTRTSPRRGHSLIEMLVAISVIGMIIPLVFTMMVTMLQAQAGQADRMMSMISLRRLATDFRRDVWSASQLKISAEARTLQLQTPAITHPEMTRKADLPITYRIEQRPHELVVHREVSGSPSENDSPTDARSTATSDRYIFPYATAEWIDSDEKVRAGKASDLAFVTLEISLPPPLVTTRTGSSGSAEAPKVWKTRISATAGQSQMIRAPIKRQWLGDQTKGHEEQQPADATTPENRGQKAPPAQNLQGVKP